MAVQWWRIKAAYLKGDMSLAQLAKKYNVGVSTIKKHASNEEWKKEKDQIETETRQAIRARAREDKIKQLEELMTATDQFCAALVDITGMVKKTPELLLGPKGDGKPADSISKALLTAVQCKRDLYKLPTLDQDMQRKAEAQRKREAKAKLDLDKEKWELTKQEKNKANNDEGRTWTINMPPELAEQGGEIDG